MVPPVGEAVNQLLATVMLRLYFVIGRSCSLRDLDTRCIYSIQS